MQLKIEGKPAFAYIDVWLEPGETIVAESDAMATMDTRIDMVAKLNGGLIGGLLRKYLGGESLFINHFTNKGQIPARITLVQSTPGDIQEKVLNNQTYCLQPGAYVASSPGIQLGLKWAGIYSWIGGEGLFKIIVSGTGTVLLGAYGGLIEKQIEGEYIVDTSHIVAYEPHMKLKTQLAAGIFASFFSGEGFVTRINGTGKVVLQTRSLSGLKGWLNRHL